MSAVVVAFLRGASWTLWLLADAIEPAEAEFARIDAAARVAGES